LLLALSFALASRGGHTVKHPEAWNCFDKGPSLKQLNTRLGEELEKGTDMRDIWITMSSSAIFFQDQIALVKKP
jgi:hypothetical protein